MVVRLMGSDYVGQGGVVWLGQETVAAPAKHAFNDLLNTATHLSSLDSLLYLAGRGDNNG